MMPTYEYLCAGCGAFEDMQPMSASALPQPCPGCGGAAPRALLTAPRMALMSGTQRLAASTNERAQHAPMTPGEYRAASRHRAGCACCTTPKALRADAPAAAKGFPAKRPWMISH
jgi:putative FmdB family regulatory protein